MMVIEPRPHGPLCAQFPWYPEIYDTAEDMHQSIIHFLPGRTLVNSDAVVMKLCDEHDIAANWECMLETSPDLPLSPPQRSP